MGRKNNLLMRSITDARQRYYTKLMQEFSTNNHGPCDGEAVSQKPAKMDSVLDLIVKSQVLRIADRSACNHVFTRYYFAPCAGVDTLSINSFSQQWLWHRQCSECGTYETRSQIFYWHYSCDEQ
jgi:hypothetical protein